MINIFCSKCLKYRDIDVKLSENTSKSQYHWTKNQHEDTPADLDIEVTLCCKYCHRRLKHKRFKLPIDEMEDR